MYLGDQPPVVLDANKRNSKDAIKPSKALVVIGEDVSSSALADISE